MDYTKVLEQMKQWVKEVSDYQLEEITKNQFTVETKSSSVDMVTEVDQRSEAMLIKRIKEVYPNHNILGEETGIDHMDSDHTWVIDPIDGTTNFVHRYPFHCISVGLKKGTETMVGVVKAPVLNYLFEAVKGNGAFLNGKRMEVAHELELSKSIIATGFPYSRKTNNMNLPYFNKIVNEVAGIRRSGSAALDLCMVAAGMLDGYWEFAINEWDMIAGKLLVEEAGGKVSFYPYEGPMLIIAGNDVIHDLLESKIKEGESGN